MCNLRALLHLSLVFCLTIEFVLSESNVLATKALIFKDNEKGIEDIKSQPEKRDSQKQEGTKTNIKVQQQQISNDEPFRPIYRQSYLHNAAPKPEQYISQAIVPQAETYYDKPEFPNALRYLTSSRKFGSKGPAVGKDTSSSSSPLAGSYISSSAGFNYAPNIYRGPLKPVAYEYQPKPPPSVQQKHELTKVAPPPQKAKGSQHNSAYVEPVTNLLFDRQSLKSFSEKGEQQYPQQQKLQEKLNHLYQPHIQFYNPHQHQSIPHQQFNARAIPHQQNLQYIIAIPLSYIRHLQQQQQQQHPHQLATGLTAPSSRYVTPLSVSNSVTPLTAAHSIIGPLARDHYGSYRPVHYISNQQAQHVATSAEQNYSNQKPQHTTQYIQVPANVLNAAHVYQNRQNEQEQQRISFQQSQPQYTYNIYQQQQPQENEQTQQHAPVYVHAAQDKTQTREAIIHVEGANLSAKNTPAKTYNDNTQIPPTPVAVAVAAPSPPPTPLSTPTSIIPLKLSSLNSFVSPTAPFEVTPIVHYNPIYVQGPPSEQQSLFGALNYQRFATNGFHATTPVPQVRLSVPPSQYYYNSLPHQHSQLHAHPYSYYPQQHQHQHQNPQQQLERHQPRIQHFQMSLEEPKTIYADYAAEQIPNIASGLPYFAQPGGVHFGTHLFHPTRTFFESPSIPAKATETASGSSVSNQHQQQPEQQQKQQQQQQKQH